MLFSSIYIVHIDSDATCPKSRVAPWRSHLTFDLDHLSMSTACASTRNPRSPTSMSRTSRSSISVLPVDQRKIINARGFGFGALPSLLPCLIGFFPRMIISRRAVARSSVSGYNKLLRRKTSLAGCADLVHRSYYGWPGSFCNTKRMMPNILCGCSGKLFARPTWTCH